MSGEKRRILIIDKLENLSRYDYVPNVNKAVEFIKNNNLLTLANGKYDIGDGCYVNVSEYLTKEEPESIKEDSKPEVLDIEYSPVKDVLAFKKNANELLNGWGDMDDVKIKKTTKEIYINGDLKGYISFSEYSQDDGEKALGLGNFMILDRNKGYGSAVIDDIVSRNKNEYSLIYAYVNAENTDAIRLYKRLGRVYDKKNPNAKNEFFVTFYDNGKYMFE